MDGLLNFEQFEWNHPYQATFVILPLLLLNPTFRPSNKTGGPFKQRKCQCLPTIQARSPSSLSAPLSSSKVKTMPPPLHSYSTQSSAEGSGLSTKKSRRAQVSRADAKASSLSPDSFPPATSRHLQRCQEDGINSISSQCKD